MFIITDYNTSVRYRFYGHRMDETEASEEAVAALGDFPHYVDQLQDEAEVELVYGKPFHSFPALPVK